MIAEPDRFELLRMTTRELVEGGDRVAFLVVVDAKGELHITGSCDENDVIAMRALDSYIDAIDHAAKSSSDCTVDPHAHIERSRTPRRSRGARS